MTTTRTSSSDRALSRMPRKIRIGSRPSKLALAQASIVRERLTKEIPGIEIEIIEIRTSGDKMTSASLADVGGKGLFIKELEQALAARTIDAAVHSMKDLPAILPQQFRVAAVLERENTADILVTRDGSRAGGAARRRAAGHVVIAAPFPGAQDESRARNPARCVAMSTRAWRACRRHLRRDHSRDGRCEAAGPRQRREVRRARRAVILFRQAGRARSRSKRWPIAMRLTLVSAINDPRAFYETAAERAFLAAIGASCTTPVGVKATYCKRYSRRSRRWCSARTARASCRSRWKRH